jgi:hypothetical protein
MQSFDDSAMLEAWNALVAGTTNYTSAAQYVFSRTVRGRFKISPSNRTKSEPGFRLLKDSGAQFLLDLGYEEGDTIDQSVFNTLEDEGHLYSPPGSLSGARLELPWKLQRRLARNGDPLNVTNRSHANRLGWREDVTGVRRKGHAKARELAFAESSQELYFRVYSKDTDGMVTYHLVESAIPILLERGIMVGDQIDPELQYMLLFGGHLYTETSGQTGY